MNQELAEMPLEDDITDSLAKFRLVVHDATRFRHQQWMGHGSIEVTEMYMAFRDRAEDAERVSDAFRVAT